MSDFFNGWPEDGEPMADCKDTQRLIERLRIKARKQCERHNNVDQFDSSWERKPKDFLEWEAADALKAVQKENHHLKKRIKLIYTSSNGDLYKRIEQLEELLALPYPPNDGKTHWEGCWQDRGHHNCAVRRIEQLEAELAESERQTRAQLSRVMKRDERIEQLEAMVTALKKEMLEAESQTCSTIFGKPYGEWKDMEARIEQLEAAIRNYIHSLEHGKTAEAMNLYLQALRQTLGEKDA